MVIGVCRCEHGYDNSTSGRSQGSSETYEVIPTARGPLLQGLLRSTHINERKINICSEVTVHVRDYRKSRLSLGLLLTNCIK